MLRRSQHPVPQPRGQARPGAVPNTKQNPKHFQHESKPCPCTRAARVTDRRHILSLTISGRSSCDQRGADAAFFVWGDSETPNYYYRADTIISVIVSFGSASMVVVVVVEGIPAFRIRRWMLDVGTRPDTTSVTYLILGFVARWSGVIPLSSKRHQQQHFGSVPGTYPKTEGIVYRIPTRRANLRRG
jgi:hypothetical protein